MDISKQIAHRCDTETLAAAQLHTPGNLRYYTTVKRKEEVRRLGPTLD